MSFDPSGLPLPPPALVKWEMEQAINKWETPVIPDAPVFSLPQVLSGEAQAIQDQRDLDQATAELDATLAKLGYDAPPAWGNGAPVQSSSTDGSIDLNGGAGSWGGGVFGTTGTATLAFGGKPLPKSTWVDRAHSATAWWNGTKWVVKRALKLTTPIRMVYSAAKIHDWAAWYWRDDPPSRVETQYRMQDARLLYKHPGDIWADWPPPGFDAAGNNMWNGDTQWD